MEDTKMVLALAMLFVSLALVFPSINCKITVYMGRNHEAAAGACGLFSDHFHPFVDDYDFSPLVEAQGALEVVQKQKLRDPSAMDEEASSPALTAIQPQWTTWSDDVRTKNALVYINPGNYTRHDSTSRRAKMAVLDDLEPMRYLTIRLPMRLAFNSAASNLSYDELVEVVATESYRSSVADYYMDFSKPYLESRVTMVVKAKPNELNKFWWFLSPFTSEMWLIVVALSLCNGFVIWIIERNHDDGPNLLEALLFLVLIRSESARSRSRLTNLVAVPWLLLMLLLTSTYTATFTSMITSSSSPTEPSCFNVGNLKMTNAIVGCDTNSRFVFKYLVHAIGLNEKNINNIAQSSIDEYAKALSSGNIEAAFFATPHANAFLAKYRSGFRAWEPIPYLQDSAFVFPRGSPFAAEMSKLKRMRGVSVSFPDCSSSTFDGSKTQGVGVGPGPFSSLFIISGGASAIALLITVIRLMKERWDNYCIVRMLMDRGLWAWLTTLFSQNRWRTQLQLLRLSSSRITST